MDEREKIQNINQKIIIHSEKFTKMRTNFLQRLITRNGELFTIGKSHDTVASFFNVIIRLLYMSVANYDKLLQFYACIEN